MYYKRPVDLNFFSYQNLGPVASRKKTSLGTDLCVKTKL